MNEQTERRVGIYGSQLWVVGTIGVVLIGAVGVMIGMMLSFTRQVDVLATQMGGLMHQKSITDQTEVALPLDEKKQPTVIVVRGCVAEPARQDREARAADESDFAESESDVVDPPTQERTSPAVEFRRWDEVVDLYGAPPG